jgi:hypothetical protein
MLVLVREKRTGKAILGRLFLGGVVVAYTLENAAKAIPAGLYSMQNSKSPKFGRELPLIYGDKVAASRGVRIHAGNSYKDSSACVLVGMGRNGEKLTESKLAETMVTMLCRNVRKIAIVEG